MVATSKRMKTRSLATKVVEHKVCPHLIDVRKAGKRSHTTSTMECARRELGRLTTYKNPYSWAVPDNDDKHRYFFLDRNTTSEEGDTPLLRLLALHACPKTVENFLRLSQALYGKESDTNVLQSNNHGISPLHVAVHRNSFFAHEIVSLLLAVDPSLVRRRMTASKSFPLHVAMANSLTIQGQVLDDLLAADPMVVYEEDINGDNPVSLLYKNVLRFRWAQAWVSHDTAPESMGAGDSSWMTVIAPDEYRDFSLAMISAAHKKRFGQAKMTWYDICSFPRFPPLLIKVLQLEIPSDSLLQPDQDGRLPLHHAAQAPALSNKSIPLHVLEESASTLELVMRLEPRAAWAADREGMYPLHYALENPTIESHVIQELMELSPVEALMTPDRCTGLLPFQLAAADKHPNLIYTLLRAEPSASHV